MSKPLYYVGEPIILQSKTFPEYNGEYAVERILYKDEVFRCRNTGKEWRWEPLCERFTYILSESFLPDERNHEVLWNESALRKKHKPSELGFKELMSSLNSPITKEQLIENKI